MSHSLFHNLLLEGKHTINICAKEFCFCTFKLHALCQGCFLKISVSCDVPQGQAEEDGEMESPFIRIRVLTQCIPVVPDPTYCFSSWLQVPDHFNSVVLTQQQMSPSIIAGHNRGVLFKGRGCLITDDQGVGLCV